MTNMDYQIIQGDALEVLRSFEPNSFDAVITDPPYSSGGLYMSAKTRSTAEKYTATKGDCPFPSFPGDCKDQRSWTSWTAEWLSACRRITKPGSPICVFIDWRQLPSLTDALQWADWTWRGIVPWDKINSRPQRGRFRQDAEFIVWGSNGDMPVERPVPVLPGCYSAKMPSNNKRLHQTEKPTDLMRALVRICVPGGRILDPFCGSGSTIEAAKLEGYSAIGIEMLPHYAEVARKRIEA